ncbi:MAG: SH3 domain-containing protein [bacterium]
MKKIGIPILSLLLLFLLLPNLVLAADELTFNTDTNIALTGVDIDLVVGAGSLMDSMVVNTNNVVIVLSANSTVTLTCAKRRTLSNTLGANTECASDVSRLVLPAQTTATTVTVTPSTSDVCGANTSSASTPAGGGGGGGGGETVTPSTPSTTTGQVTATASGGGETVVTTSDNNTASVSLPVNAVSESTVIKIEPSEKDPVISSKPIPSAKSIVGNYVFNYTAEAGGSSVSTFDKTLTLTFTYTEQQVGNLDESTLRVYYWKDSDSQWVGLTTTVNTSANTLTANTNHFTYFAILGSEPGVEDTTTIEGASTGDETLTTLVDGDLIRNPNAEGMAQFDIYIVKLVGSKKFKRLILSPHVFESYEHFDKNGNGSPWDDVIDVNQATMNVYTISDLVRAVGDEKVYNLTPTGDTGAKQWMNMTVAGFESAGYDWDAIYEINTTDRDAYTTGTEITDGSATSEPSSSEGDTIIIKVSTLRVRSLPSLDGDVLTEVAEGEVYNLLDEQDGWYKITAYGFTGWCYGGDTGGYASKQ